MKRSGLGRVMGSNLYREQLEALEERNRQMEATELMSARFPGVRSIVVTMNYVHGAGSPVRRTLSFYPENHAFFRIGPPGQERDGGGIDLTYLIHRMVRSRDRVGAGDFTRRPEGEGSAQESAGHRGDYRVAITYA